MRKVALTIAVLVYGCLLPMRGGLCGDLVADGVAAEVLKVREIGPAAAVPETVRMKDGMSVRGNFAVAKTAAFTDGVPYLYPLGDVPMGCFTNMPGHPSSSANNPAWWGARNVTGTNVACDYAAAVQGQVKWIAHQAAAEFGACLKPLGGAGTAVKGMTASFSQNNNGVPITLGQLKNVAAPFYDRLIEVGIATNHPWADTEKQANDAALANIGQVKHLFAFDFGRDTDGDGLSDGAETSVPFLLLWNATGRVERVITGCKVERVTASDSMRAALLDGGRVIIFTGSDKTLKAFTNDCGAVEIDATESWIAARTSSGRLLVWWTVAGGVSILDPGLTGVAGLSGGYRHLLVRMANRRAICLKSDDSGVPMIFANSFCTAAGSGVVSLAAGTAADVAYLTNGKLLFGDVFQTEIFLLAGVTGVPENLVAGSDRNFVVHTTNGRSCAFMKNPQGTNYRLYASPTGVSRVAGGGSVDMIAVLLNGKNAIFTSDGSAWHYSKVNQRLTEARDLWWTRDCGLAVMSDGKLLPLAVASASLANFDYHLAAVTPKGKRLGIAAVCSHSSPTDPDTDGDGVDDGAEVSNGLDPLVAVFDPDKDGVPNADESLLGTDPLNPDTDKDGLNDGAEVLQNTDPLDADTDKDRLADGSEKAVKADPLDPDTDDDGLNDGDEVRLGGDPTKTDTDGDTLNDGLEALMGTSPAHADTDGDSLTDAEETQGMTDPLMFDSDDDGLGDGAEYDFGTGPLDPDSDEDGMLDGWEVNFGFNPLAADDALSDADDDGLNNGKEAVFGTDPLNPDSDYDGLWDGWEKDWGLNCLSGFSDTLLGWWQFREGSGTNSVDLSGNGNTAYIIRPGNGTREHVRWSSWDVPIGAALQFRKDYDYKTGKEPGYVRVPGLTNAPLSSGFTLAAWIRPVEPTTFSTILSKTSAPGSTWSSGALLYGRGQFFLGKPDGLSGGVLAGYIPQWEWHHVCGVYDATNRSTLLYVDGLFHSSKTNISYFSNSEPLWIGSTFNFSTDNTPYPWDGFIADIRVYTSALSAAEVQGLVEFRSDADADGLTNRQEQDYGTYPDMADTDADDLPDGKELAFGTDPFDPDTDGDEISDGSEVQHGSNPREPTADVDGDGLTNIEEREFGTDPFLIDTDEDSLVDSAEVWVYGTNPLLSDTDDDELTDRDELMMHLTDPLKSDTDSDGLSDGFEIVHLHSLPLAPDSDGDGLSDGLEYNLYNTSCLKTDTDDDGLSDPFEIDHGLSPYLFDSDPDADDLPNWIESQWGTDPVDPDTDDDGLADGEEVAHVESGVNIPWMDISGGINVLAAIPDGDMDNGLATLPLPFPVRVGGVSSLNVTISVNGPVILLVSGSPLPSKSFSDNENLTYGRVIPHHVFIAGFWDNLVAKPAELGSSITLASAEMNGARYAVIEYRNMGFADTYAASDRLTFQVIIPEVASNRVYVAYKTASGLAAIGSSASVGAQAPGEYQNAVHAVNEQGSIHSNLRLKFILGTGTSPFNPDCDGDGLTDGAEVARGTDPCAVDTDGDGFDDRWEVEHDEYGFDPLVPSDPDGDYDGDGIEDAAEIALGTDPTNADTDGDGLSDWQEINVSLTDPINFDSDGDTLSDGWELEKGLNPLINNLTDADPTNDPTADPDDDGLNNFNEYLNNTDPSDSDTDGDRASDGVEVAQGSDPNDASDNGQPPPPDDILELPFLVYGDSASWEMVVSGLGPEDRRVLKLSTDAPGDSATKSLKLRRGNSYRITIHWLGSDRHSDPYWYCWQAQIGGLPTEQTYVNTDTLSFAVRVPGAAKTIVGDGWFADNADGLLTSHVHSNGNGTGNIAEGLTATLYVLPKMCLVPDYNRDGKIDDSEQNRTAAAEPFRFWINDDKDVDANTGSNVPGSENPDWADTVVNGLRDMTDWFPVMLDLGQTSGMIYSDKFSYWLCHEEGAVNILTDESRKPVVLFDLGCNAHVFDPVVASSLAASKSLQVPPEGVELDASFIVNALNGKGTVLLEGRSSTLESDKKLTIEVREKQSGQLLCHSSLHVSLYTVTSMYRQLNLRGVCGGTGGMATQTDQPPNLPDSETDARHVLHIHGYNINGRDAVEEQSAVFKNLWWCGSRARFHGVSWCGDTTQIPSLGRTPNFYTNAANAFATAPHVSAYVNDLSRAGEVTVIAHSLGNMVASAAICVNSAPAANYFMLDAAVAQEAYRNVTRMTHNMINENWEDFTETGYPNILFASEWHTLFPGTDSRSRLTMRGLFTDWGETAVYNFYSSGEDVLNNAPYDCANDWSDNNGLDAANHIWGAQEKLKGRIPDKIDLTDLPFWWPFWLAASVTGSAPVLSSIESYAESWMQAYINEWYPNKAGGWMVDNACLTRYYSVTEVFLGVPRYRKKTVQEMLDPVITGEAIWTLRPLFTLPPGLTVLDDSEASAYAAANRFHLLAYVFPATSYAMGKNEIEPEVDIQNWNMNDFAGCMKYGWWNKERIWTHSDFKNVCLLYTQELYKEMISRGGLK